MAEVRSKWRKFSCRWSRYVKLPLARMPPAGEARISCLIHLIRLLLLLCWKVYLPPRHQAWQLDNCKVWVLTELTDLEFGAKGGIRTSNLWLECMPSIHFGPHTNFWFESDSWVFVNEGSWVRRLMAKKQLKHWTADGPSSVAQRDSEFSNI